MIMLLKSLNMKNKFKKLFVDGEMLNPYTWSIVAFLFTFLWTIVWSIVANVSYNTMFGFAIFFSLLTGCLMFIGTKFDNKNTKRREELRIKWREEAEMVFRKEIEYNKKVMLRKN